MKEFIYMILLVALMAAFVLILMRKWRIIEWVQVHGNTFFSKMFNCNFCLSWWAAVVLSGLVAIYTGDVKYMMIPFFSTPITRILL